MFSSDANVSVIIRVRDEGHFLRRTLAALAAQCPPRVHVVVVDNESRDDSRELAGAFGATVVTLPRAEFTYGRALNRGLAAATGEFAVLLSAHSLPIGPEFIRHATQPFQNPRIAAVRCLHAANRNDMVNWTDPGIISWPIDLNEVIARGPVACCCAIRRAVWASLPFDEEIKAVEDKFWAYEVLKHGHVMCNSTATYLYMRDLTVLDSLAKLNRDRLAYYVQTGTPFDGHPQIRDLMRELLLGVPKRAARTAAQDILACFLLKTIPWQARREKKAEAHVSAPHSRQQANP